MGGLESKRVLRILGPLVSSSRNVRCGRRRGRCLAVLHSRVVESSVQQQRSEVPALAVSVSVPPYVEFGPTVDARHIRSSHLEPGAIFGLRPCGDEVRMDGLERFRVAIGSLRREHPSVPLVLRIPTPLDASAAVLIQHAAQLRVRGVLLDGEPISDALRRTLTSPVDLASDVVDWLSFRLPRLSPEVAELCRTIFREGPAVARIEMLFEPVLTELRDLTPEEAP